MTFSAVLIYPIYLVLLNGPIAFEHSVLELKKKILASTLLTLFSPSIWM